MAQILDRERVEHVGHPAVEQATDRARPGLEVGRAGQRVALFAQEGEERVGPQPMAQERGREDAAGGAIGQGVGELVARHQAFTEHSSAEILDHQVVPIRPGERQQVGRRAAG